MKNNRGRLNDSTADGYFRLTPANVTSLADKDTGDAAGDAFFSIDEYDLPMRCVNGSGTDARGCFLDVTDVYMQFEVAVDGKYGPYGHCNPPKDNSLLGNWSCKGMGAGYGPPRNSSQYCYCGSGRQNWTVGRQHVSMQFGKWPSFIGNFSKLLDGLWYSTPSQAQCPDGAMPHGGDGACSWSVLGVAKTANASCVQSRLYRLIERRNEACFEACPSFVEGALPNRATACVNSCFEEAVIGDGKDVKAMTVFEILAPWKLAFSSDDPTAGGCPRCSAFANGMRYCPTPWE